MCPGARGPNDLSHCAMKRYDEAYFRRWYHQSGTRISSAHALTRKVRLALSAAEYLLGRRVETVLDVGCGEAPWFPVLRRIRPKVRYVGVDSSPYAVQRYGRRRHIRLGTLGGLRALRLPRGFDLVVCSDVMQYVPTSELEQGLKEIRRLVEGMAYLEAFTREDAMEGDMEGWHFRSAAQYRRLFRDAGLTHCGMNCFIDTRRVRGVNALERCGP
jgi:SAM-dependent methyltransferase